MDLGERPRVNLSDNEIEYIKKMVFIHFPGSSTIEVREYVPKSKEDPLWGIDVSFRYNKKVFSTGIYESIIMPNVSSTSFIYNFLKKLEVAKKKHMRKK